MLVVRCWLFVALGIGWKTKFCAAFGVPACLIFEMLNQPGRRRRVNVGSNFEPAQLTQRWTPHLCLALEDSLLSEELRLKMPPG